MLAMCIVVPVVAEPVHNDHSQDQDNVVAVEKLCQQLFNGGCSEKEVIDYLQYVVHENVTNESSVSGLSLGEWSKQAAHGLIMGMGAALALQMVIEMSVFCFKQANSRLHL